MLVHAKTLSPIPISILLQLHVLLNTVKGKGKYEKYERYVKVVQNRMNKFVRTKSPTGSKFSKIFFEQLYTGWIVVVHLYCVFLCGIRWRHNSAANLEPRFLVSLRNDSVANYASIWKRFSLFVRVPDVLCNAVNTLQFRR